MELDDPWVVGIGQLHQPFHPQRLCLVHMRLQPAILLLHVSLLGPTLRLGQVILLFMSEVAPRVEVLPELIEGKDSLNLQARAA